MLRQEQHAHDEGIAEVTSYLKFYSFFLLVFSSLVEDSAKTSLCMDAVFCLMHAISSVRFVAQLCYQELFYCTQNAKNYFDLIKIESFGGC